MTKHAGCLIIAGLIWLGAVPSAHADAGRDAAARSFVQAFYDWYAPKAGKHTLTPEAAFRQHSEDFGRDLRRALDADFTAQAASGEVVGIDFDPFLNGQENCERYTVGEVLDEGADYRINLYSPCFSADHQMPDVIAIVAWEDGRWRFTNFEYPETGNLMEILKQVAEDRK